MATTAYDWAKVYYSIAGNYDQFNMKQFRLYLHEDSVQVETGSNGFEGTEKLFLDLVKEDIDEKGIKLLHALIWLSLAAYAWDDYDSVCAAYYMGLYYFEEAGDGSNDRQGSGRKGCTGTGRQGVMAFTTGKIFPV